MCHLGRLKDDDAPTAIAGCKVVTRIVKLHSTDQVLCQRNAPTQQGCWRFLDSERQVPTRRCA